MLYVKLEFTYFKNNEIKKEWAGMCKYQPFIVNVNDNDNNRDRMLMLTKMIRQPEHAL